MPPAHPFLANNIQLSSLFMNPQSVKGRNRRTARARTTWEPWRTALAGGLAALALGGVPHASAQSLGASATSSDFAAQEAFSIGTGARSGGSSTAGARRISIDVESSRDGAPARRVRREESSSAVRTSKPEADAVSDGKSPPPPVVPIDTASPFRFSIDAGYQSRYIYHGLDVVGFNSFNRDKVTVGGVRFADLDPASQNLLNLGNPALSSPIVYVNGGVSFKGFTFGIGFVGATSSTAPLKSFYDFFVLKLNTSGGAATIRTATYSEFQLRLDYTFAIIKGALDLSVGYNGYIFPEKAFRNTNYQGEAYAKLTFTKIPFTRISLAYFNYHSDARLPIVVSSAPQAQPSPVFGPGNVQQLFSARYAVQNTGGSYLSGSYLEFKVEGAIPVYLSDKVRVVIVPSALVSYNFGYATQGYPDLEYFNLITGQARQKRYNEFNTIEFGVRIPVTIGKHFTITPYGNFGIDISGSNGTGNSFSSASAPEKQQLWGGVQASWVF